MRLTTNSLEAFNAEARRFAARLPAGRHGLKQSPGRATIVTLSGDLGAGKTTFVQEVARTLGVQESVTSPTFVIEKLYTLKDQAFERLIHIDAYRLNSEHEIEVLGWHEIAADPGNLILIEWPEKVSQLIPDDAVRISLSGTGHERLIEIKNVPDML